MQMELLEPGNCSLYIVCVIYLSEGIVPTQWDAIFDIKTKQLRNSLGFNISVFIVYVSNG